MIAIYIFVQCLIESASYLMTKTYIAIIMQINATGMCKRVPITAAEKKFKRD
jgi:hypothetical protein